VGNVKDLLGLLFKAAGNIQDVSKINGKTSGMDSSYGETTRGYDNMGPEMYSYRVVRACIY
jgi:hypothetical protein